MKPDDQKYVSYKIEPEGRRWGVVGVWLDGYELIEDTLWQTADGGEKWMAEEKLREFRSALCDCGTVSKKPAD